jgi:uridine kinase
MSILTDLKAGNQVNMPRYDFVSHQRLEKKITVGPADYVLLEGIFALYDPAIRDLLDMKIFVDTESDLRLIRRIKRDIQQRGRSVDSVMNQYQLTVKPSHDQFVEPTKKYADIIIPRGKSNTVAIQLICSWIK